jgi:hypothetical protein
VLEIAALKRDKGLAGYDAKREEEMLQSLTSSALGPFGPAEVREIFKAIFRASLDLQDLEARKEMHVLRKDLVPKSGFLVGDVPIGGPEPVLFLGPCSVETPEQIEAIAELCRSTGRRSPRRRFAAHESAHVSGGGGLRLRARPLTGMGPSSRDLDTTLDVAAEPPTCSRSAPATCTTRSCPRRSAAPESRSS